MKNITTFLCIIVLALLTVGCMSRIDMFELSNHKPQTDEEATDDVEDPPVIEIMYPEIVIKSSTGVEIPVDGSYQFPDTEVNAFMVQTFIIENNGEADLTITDFVFINTIDPLIPSEFFITTPPMPVIIPGGLTIFDVTFMSLVEGTAEGLMVIGNNDENEFPYNIFLSAAPVVYTVPYPDISVMIDLFSIDSSGYEYFLPDTIVGGTSTITVTITNDGIDDLIINSIFMAGRPGTFNIEMPPTFILLPGNSIDFNVTFTPQRSKIHTSKLKINSNDPDINESSFAVRLTGEGI